VRHALDTLGPELLVELGVDADVARAHRLLGKLDDGLDGVRGALLEGAAVDVFVEVDGVFAGDDVLEGGARLAASLALGGGLGCLDDRHSVDCRRREGKRSSIKGCDRSEQSVVMIAGRRIRCAHHS
jgi:hypothetical protein